MTESGDAVLAQILAGQAKTQESVALVADRIAGLTSEVREANSGMREQVHNLRVDVDDHEVRLRQQESGGASFLTRDEFDTHETARSEETQRKENRRLAILGLVFAAAQVAEGVFLYWLATSR